MKTRLSFAAVVAFALLLGLSGCANWSGAQKGTAVGAVGGAALGNVLTGGSLLGTAAGAAAGGIVGHELGDDRRKHQH